MEVEGVPERDKRKGKAKVEETDQQSLPECTPMINNTKFDGVCYLAKEIEAEGVIVRDKRKGKAKLEERDQQTLPVSTPIINNIVINDVRYLKLIGHHRVIEPVDADSSSELQWRRFRFRDKDLPSVLGVEDGRLRNIHKVSGASIGIRSDQASRIHRQSYLELWGTPDEVKIAELLIADAITETSENPSAPTALMPANLCCHHSMTIPSCKVMLLLGVEGHKLLKLEMLSGAWIELNADHHPADDKTGKRVVDIYGQEAQVANAIEMIMGEISGKSIESESTWNVDVVKTLLSIQGEHQESMKFEDVETGEEAAHTRIGTPHHVQEQETTDKESGQLGSALLQVSAEEAK